MFQIFSKLRWIWFKLPPLQRSTIYEGGNYTSHLDTYSITYLEMMEFFYRILGEGPWCNLEKHSSLLQYLTNAFFFSYNSIVESLYFNRVYFTLNVNFTSFNLSSAYIFIILNTLFQLWLNFMSFSRNINWV